MSSAEGERLGVVRWIAVKYTFQQHRGNKWGFRCNEVDNMHFTIYTKSSAWWGGSGLHGA